MPYKNIDPKIWGPGLWNFLHYITLSYPENPTVIEKSYMQNFFTSLTNIIPCEKCRQNFASYLKITPLDDSILCSNYNLVKWLFDIHNKVNVSTNKHELSYDDFIKLYSTNSNKNNNYNKNISENNINTCTKSNFSIYNYISKKTMLFSIIIIVLIVIIYLNKY